MSLSSEWGRSVVVRSSPGGDVVVPPATSISSAKTHAEAGNPIVIRLRDPAAFAGERGLGGDHRGAGQSGLVTALVGRDVSETYWIPDPTRHEVGLLETLHRRGESNRTHVLLQSRPLPELQYNFSTCTGYNIDLSHNSFRLSKAAMALQHVDRTLGDDDEDEVVELGGGGETASHYTSAKTSYDRESQSHTRRKAETPPLRMSVKGFKKVVCQSLQSLQEEDYYVVKYRDYSAWAVATYRRLAKSDTVFGRKYVEQCFAVHVGRDPGELVPITEAQFLFAVDILQRQLLNQLQLRPSAQRWGDTNHDNYLQHQLDINYCALNADQFRSLGTLLGDGLRQVAVEGEEQKRRMEEERRQKEAAGGRLGGSNSRPYDAPAWYDWSPSAIRRRVQHRLEEHYLSVGRLTVQLAVLGACGYVLYRTVGGYLTQGGYDSHTRSTRGGRRGGGPSRRRDGYRGGDYYDDGYDYEARRGLFRSILMGPKEVVDYFLAGVADGG